MPLYVIFFFTWFDWQVINTDHFTIIHKPGYEYEAMQALYNLECHRQKIVTLTGNNTRRVPIVIEDLGTLSNGYANPVFYNIHFFIYPPDAGSYLEACENWYRTLSVHEYTHIAHMTRTTKTSALLTGLLGAPFQPNMYSPGWMIEGIAVYSESQVSPYDGRLNDGFFDSYMQTMISADNLPDIIETTNEPLSFPYGKSYLYGGEFYEFLAEKYGEEKFARFFEVYGSYPWAPVSAFLPALGIDMAANRVYGRSFATLFAEWNKYRAMKFPRETISGTQITKQGWYISSMVQNNNKIYYCRKIAIKQNCFSSNYIIRIMELDLNTKQEKTFATLNSDITTKIRVYDNSLYFTTAEFRRAKNVYNNGFGITSILQKIDIKSKKPSKLIKDDIRTFCVLDHTTILYVKNRNHNFGSELWLLAHDENRKIWEGDLLINDIETNGKWIVVSASRKYENPDLFYFDIDADSFVCILRTPWVEGNLYFFNENNLGFIANYYGNHRIYSIDLLSNDIMFCYTKNGFANAFIINNGETLYASMLNSNGFDINEQLPEPESCKPPVWQPSPGQNNYQQQLNIQKGTYWDIVRTAFPSIRLPILFPTDSTHRKWLYGALLVGADATESNLYVTYFGYDQLNEKLFLSSNLQSLHFSPLRLEMYYTYDDFFKVKTTYPLYNSMEPGIATIALNLNYKTYDKYQRKECSPGFSLTWHQPYFSAYLNLAIPFERISLYSNCDRTGLFGSLGFRYLLFMGEFRMLMSAFYDTQNPDAVGFSIRGYETIYARKAKVFRAEYSHQLFKLRRGLWNPNVYFEDFFCNFFFDYAMKDDRSEYHSIGVEIALETKTAFGFIRIVPKLGLAITRDKSIKTTIGLSNMLF